MGIKRLLAEQIRMARFEAIYDEYRRDELGCGEAAMILGGASQGSGDAKHRWKAQRRVFGASFFAAADAV